MTHLKLSGFCLILGGSLLFLGNAIFSPMLPVDGQAADIFGSTAFFWRLSTNALTVFLLMVGTTGIYKLQAAQSGVFGALSFGLAFTGSAFMFAHEWGQAFYMHTMAVANPEALNAMDASSPITLVIEIGLSVGFFALGWILFCVSIILAKAVPRLGPILVLSGFLAVPLLTAALSSPVWGGILGSVILSCGLVLMGIALTKASR